MESLGYKCIDLTRNQPLVTHARLDPTHTTVLRRRFEIEAVNRFKTLRRKIREELTDENFGLGPNAFGLSTNAPKYNFPRSDKKVSEFMKWLKSQSDAGILEFKQGTPMESAAERAWSSTYVRASYKKGIDSAARSMRKSKVRVEDKWVEAAFNRPFHVDRVGLAFTRTYSSLEGITRTMESQIGRALAQGLAEGLGMKEIARNITDRVDKIGITRARVLARTEVIASHAEATLNTYEEAGIEGVNVLSEFTTSQDNKVCPRCEALEGKTYSIDEARGVIPVHPNCRCAWLPVVKDGKGMVVQ